MELCHLSQSHLQDLVCDRRDSTCCSPINCDTCHPSVLQGEISRICSKSSRLLAIFCALFCSSHQQFLVFVSAIHSSFTTLSLIMSSVSPTYFRCFTKRSNWSSSDPLLSPSTHLLVYWWYPDLLCRGDLDTSSSRSRSHQIPVHPLLLSPPLKK